MNAADVAAGALGVLGTLGAGGGLWAYLAARAKLKASAPADMMSAAATFQTAINAGAEQLVQGLERRIDGLTKDLGEAQSSIRALEQDNERCQAENRALRQRYDSLDRKLAALGITTPADKLPGSFVVIEEGRTTVMRTEPVEESTP